MPRIRWMFSPRPRKRATELLGVLLNAEDLGGRDWQLQDGRVWTKGETESNDDWASRARAAGLITVWRSFRRSRTDEYWAEIAEVASSLDAIDALKAFSRYELRNPAFGGVIHSERLVAVTILDAITTAKENEIEGNERRLTSLICSFAVANYVVTIISSTPSLKIDEFTRVAELQASRLRDFSSKQQVPVQAGEAHEPDLDRHGFRGDL
jgi:hypothetical protein